MSDVDAILASGSYTDRRGTWWGYMRGIDRWVDREVTTDLTPAQMRLKIVRDLHRAECPGLDACGTHPEVTVAKGALGGWVAFPPHYDSGRAHATFAEAIAAVNNMTGERHE